MAFSYQYNQSESTVNISEWNSSYVSKEELHVVPKIGMAQGIIGMVLNTLAWLVILRTKNLHNMTNYLLAYLAVTDSTFCFSVVLYHGNVLYSNTTWWLIEGGFVQFMTGLVSSFGLCLVTYERYIGIVHPLHYPRRITLKKVTVIASLSWILSFLVLCPTLLMALHGRTSGLYIYIGFNLFGNLFPILFMSWAYYKIQATLKRSAQQLQQQNVQGAALELLQARQNVISMLRIVMGALVFLWTPLVVWLMLCSIFKDENLCGSKIGGLISLLVIVIYSMNSVINPIIYVFTYKKFRKGLQDMLCSCIGRPLRPNRIEVQIAMNEPAA